MDTFHDPEKAKRIAAANNKYDDDWSYKVEILPSGFAIIKVYDEDGEFVGNL